MGKSEVTSQALHIITALAQGSKLKKEMRFAHKELTPHTAVSL